MENWKDEDSRNWFKITVPYGRKYDKTWLLNSIRSHCNVSFTPVDFHYVRKHAQFFVKDFSTASALKAANYQIRDEDNQKISILVNPSFVSHSVLNEFKSEQMEQLKITIKKRYDVSQKSLNLQNFHLDPDLVGHDIDMILNRKNCMAATLKIIEENFPELLSLNLCNNKLYQLDGLSDIIQKAPKLKILNLSNNELKSASELEKMKGLKLEELWLEGNPMCDTFSDQATYISAIRDSFPKLLCLDGQDISPPITLQIEVSEIMKPCKESYKGPDTLKNLILQFLQEYYCIFDYGDRQGLITAYHDDACFSLTVSFKPEGQVPSSLGKYSKSSRNLKKRKDPVYLLKLLNHTKRDVIDSLSVLPKTQHDFSSFVVDLCVQTEKMLCFSVNGLFKQAEGMSQAQVYAFTRIFIVIPANNSSLCIVNDQLSVREASPAETQRAFSTPVYTPSSSSMPTLSQEQQGMVQAFSVQSKMNLQWSLKCLEDNEWNYTIAAQVFTMFKAEGKIPEEAFKQSS
ncbi:PREDICTED: nuclear RNA export factor 2-like [Chrysochloris asiatica]|uniref:Nuclear RNA export factor 2-like n=1 Tax=Chrysochloris asiatica TaxID=185453 RepID=A0A9B0X1N7_CHRAS|nr:PREDICTED: nuclear RNA export factor 2-like [Chrysochloris asiatica]